MGLIDAGLTFSENQVQTQAALFVFSSNSVNVANNNTNQKQRSIRDIAPGEPVRFISIVTETFDNLTSLQFDLFNAVIDVFDGTTPPQVLVYSQIILLADLQIGDKAVDVAIPNDLLPAPPLTNLFYKARYTRVGAQPTTGQLSTHFGWGSFAASHDVT